MAMNPLAAVQNIFGSLVTATVEVPLVAVIGVFFVGLLFGSLMSRCGNHRRRAMNPCIA